ncbi:MAG: hypothetical protein GKR96_14485 [Gammaproteobacteria bacterium]|nr:hypothetical protein [Gammaproteobacteria bacterium]
MTNNEIDIDTIEQLNVILPLQLMAVQQHFIHVLILDCWQTETSPSQPILSQGIAAIDKIDLPNAMKIVDLLVSSGNVPNVGENSDSQLIQMPRPGDTYQRIFSAERAIEKKLTTALKTATETLTSNPNWSQIAHLITDPLAARNSFEVWMRFHENTGLPTNKSKSPLSGTSLSNLNHYFCYLVLSINQTMIHAFVHWHEGNKTLADATWKTSTSAMMLAARITRTLSMRGLAPGPFSSFRLEEQFPQKIGINSESALDFDRKLALRAGVSAGKAASTLKQAELEVQCRDGEKYFNNMGNWKRGENLPTVSSSCQSFERVLNEYGLGSE